MLSCSKCNYEITSKMRYCLIKNFCPSCGNSLLTEENSEKLKEMSARLRSQEFVTKLGSVVEESAFQLFIHDLSIFICFEMNGEPLLPAEVDKVSRDSDDQSSSFKRVPKRISRHEDGKSVGILSKRISRIDDESDDEDNPNVFDDDDSDDKVRRLKEVYRNSTILNKIKSSSNIV